MGVYLKDEKGVTLDDAIQSILNDSGRKPNKIWVNQGSKFFNKYFKKWLDDNSIKIYSTHKEGRSVISGRFIRTLKIRFTTLWPPYQKRLILICQMIFLINTRTNIIEQLKWSHSC